MTATRRKKMKQNEFYEVDGCTDFIPVKLIKDHKHIMNILEVEVAESGYRTLVQNIYSFPEPHEPQKPVVPKFVADYYESIKDDFEDKVYDLCLQFDRDNGELSSEIWEWFNRGKNEPIQTLVKMKLYGYEVEQEKLYTVRIPNPNRTGGKLVLFKHKSTGRLILDMLNPIINTPKYLHLTESEIKQDFEWAWQFANELIY